MLEVIHVQIDSYSSHSCIDLVVLDLNPVLNYTEPRVLASAPKCFIGEWMIRFTKLQGLNFCSSFLLCVSVHRDSLTIEQLISSYSIVLYYLHYFYILPTCPTPI